MTMSAPQCPIPGCFLEHPHVHPWSEPHGIPLPDPAALLHSMVDVTDRYLEREVERTRREINLAVVYHVTAVRALDNFRRINPKGGARRG